MSTAGRLPWDIPSAAVARALRLRFCMKCSSVKSGGVWRHSASAAAWAWRWRWRMWLNPYANRGPCSACWGRTCLETAATTTSIFLPRQKREKQGQVTLRLTDAGGASTPMSVGHSEVGSADMIARSQFVARTFEGYPPRFHDVAILSNLQRLVGVLSREQDGDALRRNPTYHLENLLHQNGR